MMPTSSEIKKMVLDYFEVRASHTIMVMSFHTQSTDRGFCGFQRALISDSWSEVCFLS